MSISISLSIHPDSEEAATKATEALSRVAIGLAWEGMDVNVSVVHFDPDSEEKT